MLRPLLISVQRDDGAGALAPERSQNGGQSPTCACVFCGASLGLHADDGRSCAICTLVRHLERPRIDEEARLVWLPEMSQAALVCLLREMHCRMRDAGESCCGEGGPAVVSEERAALHYARTALEGRAAVAAEHLGTERPSDLAHVLARMPRATYERRHRLLGGLRVLPVGRFFAAAADVYPAIVDSWRNGPAPVPAAAPATPDAA